MQNKIVSITDSINIGADGSKLLLIAGPCQIESRDHSLLMLEKILKQLEYLPVQFVYKSSFDKANRTSLKGKRGVGMDEGLRIFEEIKKDFKVPAVTDIHSPEQAAVVGEVVDILQIPAFLCRQTDLLLAAGRTGKAVNVKKGQFLAPNDMKFAAEKIASTGNNKIMLCERGTCFGYRDLIFDPRSLEIMKETGYPVIFDATHSVQAMGGENGTSSGNTRYIEPYCRAAVAIGVSGLFIECHQDPKNAPSDGDSMLEVSQLRKLIEKLLKIHSC